MTERSVEGNKKEENIPRTTKLADQPLAGAEVRDDAPAGYALHDVFAVPGDQVSVVDYVLLAFLELWSSHESY